MREELRSFCRLCIGACGMVLTRQDGRLVDIRPDRDHPITRGYACYKGLQAIEAHHGPARVCHTLRRRPDGDGFERIATADALDEAALRLRAIVERDGPDAVALFRGTAAFHTSTAFRVHGAFMRALGSRSTYTTLTIDQSAKYIAAGRLGSWQAGQIHIDAAEVLLVFGCNPLVSHSAGGMLVTDPVRRLKAARARGMKLIVVDPRRSETAHHADLHLQPRPGHDAAIAAALLREVMVQGWHDAAFCDQHVDGLEHLRAAVQPFGVDAVAALTGLQADDLRAAARLFATPTRRGAVITGTGTDMGPRSNLAEHLVQCLDVVCGHFKRAGDAMPHFDPLQPLTPWHAEVRAPTRPWDLGEPSRIRGVGQLYGEKLSATLADEILSPGPGQIRALIVDGANPATSVPDQARMEAALDALELLVVIDPHDTPTSMRSHLRFTPRLAYEREDLTLTLGKPLYPDAWAQHTGVVIEPPADHDAIDDWQVFVGLAERLQLPLQQALGDQTWPPTSRSLLAGGLRHARISLDEILARPGGIWVGRDQVATVLPARPGAGRFAVAPDDVVDEIADVAEALAKALAPAGTVTPVATAGWSLVVRRLRDLNNSNGLASGAIRLRLPHNPLHMHPDDLRRGPFVAGVRVLVCSAHGQIEARLQADPTLRPGVLAMAHGWGSAGMDEPGTNTLISCRQPVEALNAMPRMSAIPVTLARLPHPNPETSR